MADNTIDTLSLEIKSSANSAVNSINRLAEALTKLSTSLGKVDSSRFVALSIGIERMSTSVGRFSQTVKTADFTRIANGLQRIAGVDVAGLNNATQAISTLSTNLTRLSAISFDSQGILNISNSIAQLGRKTVTQAAKNIPKLTIALSGLITELNALGTINFDVSSLANLVSSITRLGGKSATNAIPNIKALGIALKEMMQILSSAPSVSQNLIQMTQALAQLAANLRGVSSSGGGAAGGLLNVGSAASRTKKHVFSLAAAFGKFYAIYWLVLRGFRMFKKAIDISSDLVEVQNVVDVTFGKMADKVEALSKVSIRDFGMSELTTKQISSRFQAMGVAMGFAQDEMSNMSIELTKLAADMASFYNVEQEMVAEKLAAIFTGQTRPLRDFGLDLTQATLQEWAMNQGIDANIKSMSQAEKTLLRYRYVLANTTAAQGDFARTSGTWANQTRILAQSFEQLGSVIGGALINAFKPLVAWLNRAMLSIISFAQTVVNALGKIFGWTYEIKGGGIANDFEVAGDGAEDMADGTGKAKDNLEKMQKYIAAWHEVNNMTTKDDDAGGGKGGGGGGGLGDLGDATSGQLVRTEGLFEKYKSDIDSLYELGEYIGKVLTDAMNSIDWDKVYEKARNFGKGLADFLNGLISPELFGAVGRTIAGALNTAIYAALSFGERFDWKDFGLSIATGINEFFKTFDFASLAKTVNVWAKGILDTIITVLDKTNWKLMGEKIGTFLAGIDLMEIMGKVAKAIWKALNAAFDTYSRMFEVAPFETALLTLVAIPKLFKFAQFKKIIDLFSSGFTIIGNFFGALASGQGVIGALMVSFPKLGKVLTVVGDSLMYVITGMRTMGAGGLLSGISAGFANISQNLSASQKGFIGITAAFAEFAIFKNITRDMETGTENIVTGLLKLAATAGIAGTALSAVFGFPAGVIAMGVIALTGALFGLNEAQNEIVENSSIGQFSNSIDELSENIASKTETIKNNISSMKENLESSGAAQSQMARDLADEYVELSEKTGLTANEQIRLKEISEQLVGIVPGLSDYINDQTGVLEIQKDTLNDLVKNMDLYAKKQAAQEMLVEAYKAQYEAAVNVQKAEEGMAEAAENFINANDGMADSVKNMVKEGDIEGLKELRQELWEGTSEFGSLKEAFGEGTKNIGMVDKMIESLEQSMGGYTEALSDANGVLNDSNKMIDFANDAYMESAKAISENEAKMIENTKATTEYQQKLRDITSELSKFGTAFSEEFKEKLALDDTNMVNSVVEAFSKMDQQVQLSAGELQQLFANIAPGMSNHFINALAGQEPAIQAQVSATMANISSGAQVSSDEVKGVFSAIGYDLPQETINSFLSQESPLQSSVIGLLSSVANGSSLVSENLYALFRGLGIGLPNELIETLGGPNVSAETQQAAINLLSQLAAGCDMSAEEIQNRFVEFGLQIPEVLQTAIDSGTTQTYLKAQGLLNELSSAASEEERQRIVAEYNALGQGVLDEGIIAALGDEKGEVRSAALGVINEISSATTGEEREAAIAAANSFATDYIGEISGTMTSLADSKMPEVGKHIFGGVASGMMEGNGEMATAAESVMSRTEGDLRKAGKIHSPSERMMPIGSYLLQGIIEGFTSSFGQWTASITTWATETYNLFNSNITKTITDATSWFSELPGKIYTAIFPTNERVTTWGGEVFQTFQTNVDNSIAGVVDWFSELPEKIYETIINFVTQTLPQWEGNINDFFGHAIPNIIGNVVDLFGDLRESLVPVGENLIKGLWDGIQSLTDWLGTKIGGFCRGVISTFKEGFDEHSPSKEAFKIGEYFTIGLQNGLSERFTDVYGDVESLAKDINSIRISPLIFDDSLPTIEDYTPKFGDMGAIQSKIQMEIDAKMAQMAYEERRTQEMLEQIIEAIDRKQLIVGDKDIFEANKRETLRFGRRTKKDPYPIYGKS